MDKGELIVREATAKDLEDLVWLNALFNDVIISTTYLAQQMDTPNRVETALIARMGNTVIGFAALRIVPCLFYPDPQGEITELYVLAPYRRQGVAKKMIEYAENLARQKNVRELFILVNPENREAIALYHHLGYKDNDVALSKLLD